MKQRKKEKALLKELESIKQQKNIDDINIKQLEQQMSILIQRAAHFYQDQLDQNMAQFYFEYGSIVVQSLEQSNELFSHNSLNCVDISKNDRELKDQQIAFENLETANTIFKRKLDKLNIEYYKLQEQIQIIKQQIHETQSQQALVYLRIGDLQTFREEYVDSLLNFQQALEGLKGSRNLKELSVAHYKIGNTILLQNLQECEKLALEHLIKSFKLAYESQKNVQCEYDLTSLKSIQKLQVNDELLKMLLEKIEDTYIQLNEVIQCEKEVNKWIQQSDQGKVVYLGRITKDCQDIGGIKIIRR